MLKILKTLALSFALLGLSPALLLSVGAEARAAYTPEAQAPAAQTCPRDMVVWVNTKSGIYHLPGMRWYGRTAEGEYVCRRAADQAGYHSTHNGQ